MALFTLFAIHLLIIIKINYIATFRDELAYSGEYDLFPEEYPIIPSSSLYGPADKLTILMAYELEESIYNSTTAWLVLFYDSRMDPLITVSKTFSTFWKHFAASIINWQDIINVGVFDCVDDRTTDFQLCDKYKSWEFANVRYYPPFLRNFNLGEHVEIPLECPNPVLPTWRAEIIKHLQNTKKKPIYWPNLSSVCSENEIESIWKAYNGRLLVLVVENVESYVGRELIMDLDAARAVVVRYTNNMEFANPKEELPQILIIWPDIQNSRKQIRLTNTTRAGVYHTVRNHLREEGYAIHNMIFDTQLDNEKNRGPETYAKPFTQCDNISPKRLGIFGGKISKDECVKIKEFKKAHPLLSLILF